MWNYKIAMATVRTQPKWRQGLKMLQILMLRHKKTLPKTWTPVKAQLTGWEFLRTGVMKMLRQKPWEASSWTAG